MTITYYQRDTVTGDTVFDATYTAAGHWLLSTTTAATGTVTASWTGNTIRAFHWLTAAGQPNSADWPNGTFNVQADINAIGADIVVDEGTVVRVSAAGSVDLEQSADFITTNWTTTGLHTGSVTLDFAANLATDRFGLKLLATNSNSHKSETLTFNVNTVDEYADGPWSDGGAVLTATGAAAATQTAANTTSATRTETGVATAAQTAGNTTAAALTETGTATASQVAAFGFAASLTEASNAAATVDATVSAAQTASLTESGNAAATVTAERTQVALVTETGAADATQVVLATFAPAITEAGTATATQTAAAATSAALTETGTATATVDATVSVLVPAALTETGAATDSLTATHTLAANVSESYHNDIPVSIGTVQNKTDQAATVLTTTAAVPAGALIAVCISVDGDEDVSTVADSAGNSYSLADSDATSGFITGAIYYKENAAALASGETITVTWVTSAVAKAISAVYVEGIVTSSALDKTGTATGLSGTPSVSTSVDTAEARDLTIGIVATQGPEGDTFTQDASPAYATPPDRVGTTGGTITSNRTVAGGYFVETAVGTKTYNPTITARRWAAIIATFKIAGLATATVTANATFAAAITEAGTAAATQTAGNATPVAVTETGAATASQIATVGVANAITETATATDSLTVTIAFAVDLTETTSATDAQAAVAAFVASITEAGAANDNITATIPGAPETTVFKFIRRGGRRIRTRRAA